MAKLYQMRNSTLQILETLKAQPIYSHSPKWSLFRVSPKGEWSLVGLYKTPEEVAQAFENQIDVTMPWDGYGLEIRLDGQTVKLFPTE